MTNTRKPPVPVNGQRMIRHFTVSGFVVERDGVYLHWHPKIALWLPPGGHIDPDEDPVQAVLRETLEETGFRCHPHIDMSYVLRPIAGVAREEPERDHGFRWVSEEELRRNDPLPVVACGVEVCVPDDVRLIGLRAIALVRGTSPQRR